MAVGETHCQPSSLLEVCLMKRTVYEERAAYTSRVTVVARVAETCEDGG